MNDRTITVYVGDVTEELAQQARREHAHAELITPANHADLGPGAYYVSIGDLDDLCQFGTVLRQANHIVYCQPQTWSDTGLGHSRMKSWTEDYLSVFCCDDSKTVQGFVLPPTGMEAMTDLADVRRGTEPQIWIAGCSISHGVGVDRDQTYGAILCQELGMPVSYLTCPGASVAWAADQIMRSDVRSGDAVFWGLTSTNRFSYWNDAMHKISHCTPRNWSNEKTFLRTLIQEQFLASDHMIYQCVTAVKQVFNFCQQAGTRLIMATVLSGLERYVRELPGFVPAAGTHGRNFGDMFLDVGTDGEHPGPRSHRYFADLMLAKFHKGDQT